MQEYLMETEIDISLDEKKWIFKCRKIMLILKLTYNGNMKTFGAILVKKIPLKQKKHLLHCKVLLGANEILSYIPEYNELFSEDLNEVVYISRTLKENFIRRKKYLNVN